MGIIWRPANIGSPNCATSPPAAPSASAELPRSPSPTGHAGNGGPETHSTARTFTGQPWKLAGWLLVVLLSLMVLVPVLGVIAYLAPAYQRAQHQRDARQRQATMANLTMTFDEDLPITDILIDGTSCGQVIISPVKTGWSSGEHTVTVVYAHGERRRSVRETIKLAPNENLTLDLTPLVLADIKRRDREKKNADRQAPILRNLHTFGANDGPISADAKWVGNELVVTATKAGTVRLFELPLEQIDQSVILFRFRVKAEDLDSSAYAEMWCRLAGFGESFSRGLDKKVHGKSNWMSIEIPFFLKKNEFADLLKLNLVFEGPGKVRMSDIQVLAAPLGGQDAQPQAKAEGTSDSSPEGMSELSSSTALSEAPGAQADVAWGKPVREVQLGWRIEPKKQAYQPGDLFTVSLFLRNVGQQPIYSSMPRTQVLEKLGLDIDLRDSNQMKAPWRWGSARQNDQEVSGAFEITLEPNVLYSLPPFIVAVGKLSEQAPGNSKTIMVELEPSPDADPLTADEPLRTLRLTFKLSSLGYQRGLEAELESEAFKFAVANSNGSSH